MSQRSLWGKLRLIFLIAVLIIVALNAWLSKVRTTDWQDPLWLIIYPINADRRSDTQLFINALEREHFEDIEIFINREAQRYGVKLERPIEVYLAPPVDGILPKPPKNASILESVLWSLQMRYWAWVHDSWEGPKPDIKVYLQLFSIQNTQVLEHSLGLQKGMIGVVNGFASIDYQAQNGFVITHELLHTLGASDKYDLSTNQPLWPHGYAAPGLEPLLPQNKAEIMGGRVAISRTESVMPDSLQDVIVGEQTAQEINWKSAQ